MSECCEKCRNNEKTNTILIKKLTELEERIAFLERKHKRNLKKVNVLQWLNQNGKQSNEKEYKYYE